MKWRNDVLRRDVPGGGDESDSALSAPEYSARSPYRSEFFPHFLKNLAYSFYRMKQKRKKLEILLEFIGYAKLFKSKCGVFETIKFS